MNTILLTSGTGRQAGALPRTASATYASPQPGGATAGEAQREEAIVKPLFQGGPTRSYRKWAMAGAGVETALFVSVQAVMIVCIVLVAAQLIATA